MSLQILEEITASASADLTTEGLSADERGRRARAHYKRLLAQPLNQDHGALMKAYMAVAALCGRIGNDAKRGGEGGCELLELALQLGQTVYDLADDGFGSPEDQRRAMMVAGIVLYENDRGREALAPLAAALRIARTLNDPVAPGSVLVNIGNVLLHLGDLGRAGGAYRAAHTIVAPHMEHPDAQIRIGAAYIGALAMVNLSLCLYQSGRFKEALDAANRVFELPVHTPNFPEASYFLPLAHAYRARPLARFGKIAEAEKEIDLATARLSKAGTKRLKCTIDAVRALIFCLADDPDHDAAQVLLNKALAEADKSPLPEEATRLIGSDVLKAAGDLEGALRSNRAVLGVYLRAGANGLDESVSFDVDLGQPAMAHRWLQDDDRVVSLSLAQSLAARPPSARPALLIEMAERAATMIGEDPSDLRRAANLAKKTLQRMGAPQSVVQEGELTAATRDFSCVTLPVALRKRVASGDRVRETDVFVFRMHLATAAEMLKTAFIADSTGLADKLLEFARRRADDVAPLAASSLGYAHVPMSLGARAATIAAAFVSMTSTSSLHGAMTVDAASNFVASRFTEPQDLPIVAAMRELAEIH